MSDETLSQLVKLKIHYTFDNEHRNDHLSKPPQTQEIQTFVNEEGHTIGVIDLRTCLEAVVASSPELTSHIDSEFTVYAYDYSESNTPLVGQGILSRVLGQDADAEAMVTGKVTKNVMAKFSPNAPSFLEVKLRFTPIASAFGRGRSGSMSSVASGVQQFSNFSQNMVDMPRPQSPAEVARFDNMQRMLSQGGPRRDSTYNSFSGSGSRSNSRPGTPTQQYQLPPQPMLHSRQNSVIASRQSPPGRNDSFSGYYSADEQFEDGPARKRARMTQVRQPSKADLNIERQPNSLRMMASSAQSVRLHRPTPVNPTQALQQGLSAEDPVRPPTPIPQIRKPRGRPRKQRSYPNLEKSSRRQSSPAPEHLPLPLPINSSMSPEETRHNLREAMMSTPADLPSSPPIMPDATAAMSPEVAEDIQHDETYNATNQEQLFDPTDVGLNDFADFMNGDVDNAFPNFGNMQFDSLQTQYPAVFDDDSTFGGPTPQPEPSPAHVPTPYIQPQQESVNMPPPVRAPVTSFLAGNQVRSKTPMLTPRPVGVPHLFRTQSNLPAIPASDPAPMAFHRANTWTGNGGDAVMSDGPGPGLVDSKRNKAVKKIGKEQTKARLAQAIATGVMPPFCDNCGAIETPAWRRAYAKIFYCPLEEVEVSEEAGKCCYKEVHERNGDGSVKSVKAYKREQLSGDKSSEWVKLNFCNPCGLWFQKQRYPRPPEKWQKKNSDSDKKRRRRPSKPKLREQPPRAAASNLGSEAQDPPSEDSSPADTSAEDDCDDSMTANGEGAYDSAEPELPPQQPRSANAGLKRSVMFTFDARQIQSSPLKRGSVEEPIHIDLTPRPLRRVLFPSPDQTRLKATPTQPSAEIDNELLPSFVRRSPRLQKTHHVSDGYFAHMAVAVDGQENVSPNFGEHHNIIHDLFGDDMLLPPMTPTPKRRSERIANRTPGRDFGLDVSTNIQRSPSTHRTPKARTNMADMFFDTEQDPGNMTPFTRALHGARKTPKVKTGATPKRGTPRPFEFPDLPSLNSSSPMSRPLNTTARFGVSELSTDRLDSEQEPLTTDMAMPSSPPGWNNMDDFLNMDMTAMGWDDLDLDAAFRTPKKGQARSYEEKTPGSVRRSLRKSR